MPHVIAFSRAYRTLLCAAACAVALIGSGCTNTSLTLYPEFPAKKGSIGKSMLLADYVILDATMGDTNIVDIAGNKQMAVMLMDEVSDLLNEKEYHVENRLLSSMGLLMNKHTTARVMHTIEDKELDEDQLALKNPPFYVYRVFERDTLKQLLAAFYLALINSSKVEGGPNPVIAEAVALPFETVLNGSVERLYSLKSEVAQAGVKAVTGIKMPTHPKRRFQDGVGGDTYKEWKVSKAWCRQVFLRQWEEKLRVAWESPWLDLS